MQFSGKMWWALLPIYINVGASLNDGDYFWVPVWAILGAASTYCIWMTEGLFRRRDYVWGAIALLCGFSVLIVNLANAIGSTAEHRINKAAPLESKIKSELTLKTEEAELADKLTRLGWVTRGDDAIVIRRSVEQIKADPLYRRSGQCLDVTKPDSGNVCSHLRAEEARLDAALKIETLEARRGEIRAKLLKNDAPPVSDAQIGTIKRLLARIVDFDEAFIAAGLNGLLSVVIEIIGSIVPAVAERLEARSKNGEGTGDSLATDLPDPPELASDLPVIIENLLPDITDDTPEESPALCPQEVARNFIRDVVEGDGRAYILTRPFYKNYAEWGARNELPVVSETTMGRLMEEHGYVKGKRENGRRCYLGVRMKRMELRVVK